MQRLTPHTRANPIQILIPRVDPSPNRNDLSLTFPRDVLKIIVLNIGLPSKALLGRMT